MPKRAMGEGESPAAHATMGEGAKEAKATPQPDEVLGQGGFGKVVRLGDRARKIFFRSVDGDVAYSTLRELLALHHCAARLQDDAPCAIEMMSYSARSRYIDMPVALGSLRVLYRKGVVDDVQTAHYASAIWKALGHVHAVGLIHRDLKPDNVLLFADDRLADGLHQVRIADFGASIVLTHGGSVREEDVCTYVYASPEVLRGQEYDYLCDYWSLGVLIAEAKLGVVPFQSRRKADAVLRLHETREMEQLRRLIPPEWAFLLARHTDARRHPGRRFTPHQCREEDLSDWPAATTRECPLVRKLTVEWMVDVFSTLGIRSTCFPLAVSFADRCMCTFAPSDRRSIESYACVAVLVVAKIFADYLVDVTDVARQSSRGVEARQIVDDELKALERFGLDLLVHPIRSKLPTVAASMW